MRRRRSPVGSSSCSTHSSSPRPARWRGVGSGCSQGRSKNCHWVVLSQQQNQQGKKDASLLQSTGEEERLAHANNSSSTGNEVIQTVLPVLLYMLLSPLLVCCNKLLFSRSRIAAPLAISLLQQVTAVVLLLLLRWWLYVTARGGSSSSRTSSGPALLFPRLAWQTPAWRPVTPCKQQQQLQQETPTTRQEDGELHHTQEDPAPLQQQQSERRVLQCLNRSQQTQVEQQQLLRRRRRCVLQCPSERQENRAAVRGSLRPPAQQQHPQQQQVQQQNKKEEREHRPDGQKQEDAELCRVFGLPLFSKQMFSACAPVALPFTLMICCANRCLYTTQLSGYQVARCVAIPLQLLLEIVDTRNSSSTSSRNSSGSRTSSSSSSIDNDSRRSSSRKCSSTSGSKPGTGDSRSTARSTAGSRGSSGRSASRRCGGGRSSGSEGERRCGHRPAEAGCRVGSRSCARRSMKLVGRRTSSSCQVASSSSSTSGERRCTGVATSSSNSRSVRRTRRGTTPEDDKGDSSAQRETRRKKEQTRCSSKSANIRGTWRTPHDSSRWGCSTEAACCSGGAFGDTEMKPLRDGRAWHALRILSPLLSSMHSLVYLSSERAPAASLSKEGDTCPAPRRAQQQKRKQWTRRHHQEPERSQKQQQGQPERDQQRQEEEARQQQLEQEPREAEGRRQQEQTQQREQQHKGRTEGQQQQREAQQGLLDAPRGDTQMLQENEQEERFFCALLLAFRPFMSAEGASRLLFPSLLLQRLQQLQVSQRRLAACGCIATGFALAAGYGQQLSAEGIITGFVASFFGALHMNVAAYVLNRARKQQRRQQWQTRQPRRETQARHREEQLLWEKGRPQQAHQQQQQEVRKSDTESGSDTGEGQVLRHLRGVGLLQQRAPQQEQQQQEKNELQQQRQRPEQGEVQPQEEKQQRRRQDAWQQRVGQFVPHAAQQPLLRNSAKSVCWGKKREHPESRPAAGRQFVFTPKAQQATWGQKTMGRGSCTAENIQLEVTLHAAAATILLLVPLAFAELYVLYGGFLSNSSRGEVAPDSVGRWEVPGTSTSAGWYSSSTGEEKQRARKLLMPWFLLPYHSANFSRRATLGTILQQRQELDSKALRSARDLGFASKLGDLWEHLTAGVGFTTFGLLLASGVLAALLPLTSYFCFDRLSPLSCCILGFFKSCCQMLLCPLVVGEAPFPAPAAAMACVVSLCGCALYAYDSYAKIRGDTPPASESRGYTKNREA